MSHGTSCSTAQSVTNSPAAATGKQQTWFALLALILGILVGNSVTRQNAPALIVFALTNAALYFLVRKGYGSSLLIFSVMLTMLIALSIPKILALFSTGGNSGSLWTIFGAFAGLGLLAAWLAVARRPAEAVPVTTTHLKAIPRRTHTSVDLLLTTVSKIPTFVKRLRPLPQRQSPGSGAGTSPDAAEYVCRALPTPPQPYPEQRLPRWPGAADGRRR